MGRHCRAPARRRTREATGRARTTSVTRSASRFAPSARADRRPRSRAWSGRSRARGQASTRSLNRSSSGSAVQGGTVRVDTGALAAEAVVIRVPVGPLQRRAARVHRDRRRDRRQTHDVGRRRSRSRSRRDRAGSLGQRRRAQSSAPRQRSQLRAAPEGTGPSIATARRRRRGLPAGERQLTGSVGVMVGFGRDRATPTAGTAATPSGAHCKTIRRSDQGRRTLLGAPRRRTHARLRRPRHRQRRHDDGVRDPDRPGRRRGRDARLDWPAGDQRHRCAGASAPGLERQLEPAACRARLPVAALQRQRPALHADRGATAATYAVTADDAATGCSRSCMRRPVPPPRTRSAERPQSSAAPAAGPTTSATAAADGHRSEQRLGSQAHGTWRRYDRRRLQLVPLRRVGRALPLDSRCDEVHLHPGRRGCRAHARLRRPCRLTARPRTHRSSARSRPLARRSRRPPSRRSPALPRPARRSRRRAAAGAMPPSSLAYQWQRCNANGRLCTPIAGATASTLHGECSGQRPHTPRGGDGVAQRRRPARAQHAHRRRLVTGRLSRRGCRPRGPASRRRARARSGKP